MRTSDGDEASHSPGRYRIRVQGYLGPGWKEWLEGFSVDVEAGGVTTLVGSVADQAALFAALKRIRDMGLTLVSAERSSSGPGDGEKEVV
jgi:hypothetical protein